MRGRSSTLVVLFILPLLVVLASGTAEARPGIVGFSGRPFNGSSDTCTACHTGSTDPPRLDITAPDTIAAGATGQVTVVVAGSRVRTSLNASLPDGVHAIAGTNTSVPIPLDAPNEVAAVTPAPSGATGAYAFGFVAPTVNGPLTVWVAAVSANGNGAPTGDGVAAATRTITVVGGTDPAATPPAPAGGTEASSGPVHAFDPFGSSPPASSANAAPMPTSPSPSPPARPDAVSSPEVEAGGCAASARSPGEGPAALLLLALAVLALRARRRRGRYWLFAQTSPGGGRAIAKSCVGSP